MYLCGSVFTCCDCVDQDQVDDGSVYLCDCVVCHQDKVDDGSVYLCDCVVMGVCTCAIVFVVYLCDCVVWMTGVCTCVIVLCLSSGPGG